MSESPKLNIALDVNAVQTLMAALDSHSFVLQQNLGALKQTIADQGNQQLAELQKQATPEEPAEQTAAA